MASLYQQAGSAVWYVRYELHGRLYRESTGTHNEADARAVLKRKESEVAQARLAKKMGLPVPTMGVDAKMTLATFLGKLEEHYVNAGGPALRESRERSWKTDIYSLRTGGDPATGIFDFLERKGVNQIAKVERRHIEAFRDWRLTTGVSAATVNKAIRVGRAAWSWAIASGIARDPNPFKGVKPIKLPQYEPRVLTDVEVKRMLNAAKGEGQFFLVVALALYAGLRRAEVVALEWTDIDLTAKRIGVRCDETFHTKSRKSRYVPIAPELAAILKASALPVGLCLRSPREKEKPEPLKGISVTHAVTRIAEAAKVECSLHDLRRTFASMLAAQGVPTTRIRDYLGHASIATTEGYYVARGSSDGDDVAGLSFGVKAERTKRKTGAA